VPVEQAHKAFLPPAEIDAGASRAECRLVRVYDKDGAAFGVIELRANLAVRTWPGSEFQPPGVFTVEIVRDGCIDGSSPAASLTMKAGLTGTAVVGGKTAEGKKGLETHDVKVLWTRTIERSAAR
jgi:hypothetical protein